jgi:gliding motility-associated-like protein
MKRILYFCLFLISLCFTNSLKAQPGSFSITPQYQCYNSSGTYTAHAAIVLPVAAATNHSWTVIGPTGCNPTFSVSANQTASNTAIDITAPCCGDFTVVCVGYNGSIPLVAYSYAFLTPPNTNSTMVVFCPITAPPVSSSSVICSGSSATLTGPSPSISNISNPTQGGTVTYTWSNGANTPTISISPTANICGLTYTATINTNYTLASPTSCTVTPSAAACVSVQAINTSITPTAQTMCLGSPICFTATAAPLTPTAYVAGTSILSYSWYAPPNNPPAGPAFGGSGASPSSSICTAAAAGAYSVVITHTGAAGQCTVQQTSNVIISTSLSLNVVASSSLICPGESVTLTAVGANTTASSFTWTQSSPPGGSFIGNPVVRNPATLCRSYTVDVDFGGCPGQGTISICQRTLTPPLAAFVGTTNITSSCPGRTFTLSSSAPSVGVTYTFTAWSPTNAPSGTVIPKASGTISTVPYTPTTSLPMQFCVAQASSGCTGTTCITIQERTLFPTLLVNGSTSASVCPLTEFTLRAANVGTTGTTYTFQAGYTPFTTVATASNNVILHTPPTTNSTFPQTYTVQVDSAGCVGSATTQVNRLTLTPTLVPSSPSICAGTQLTLTSHGAATNFTFTAPTNTPGTNTVISSGTQDFTIHTPPFGGTVNVVTYTVNVDSVGCIGSATRTVGILDLGPTMSLSASPLTRSVCPGSTVTIKALGAVNYTFVSPTSNNVFMTGTVVTKHDTLWGTDNTPTIIPSGGVTYTVLGDSAGCKGIKTINIFEKKLSPILVLTPTLVCRNQPITLSTASVGTGPMVTYTFIAAPPPPPSVTPVIIPNGAPGTSSTITSPSAILVYTVEVDSTGGGGVGHCVGISPGATINIRPDLAIIPATSAASVCPGLTATLSVTGPTAATSIQYFWNQISGNPSGSIAPYPAPADTAIAYPITNSTYSIHATDSLGCEGNATITVGVDPVNLTYPISLASNGSTICYVPVPQSVTLTATSTISPNNNTTLGNITYTWSPTTGLTPSSGQSATVVASPSVTTIYTVTSSNPHGCVAQNTILVPVGIFPTITPVPTASGICAGFTSTITAFGAQSYTWTGTTFTGAIIQQSISVIPGTYSVVGSNGGGCVNYTAVTITSLSPLSINVTQSSPTTCISSNSPKFSKAVHLTASGAGTYVWFPYNPAYMTYSLGPQTDVRPPASTCYTVIGSTAICSGSTNICVNVIPQFSMNVTPPLPAICLGDSLKLSIVNIGTLAAGPPSAYTYSWTEALNAPPVSVSSYFTPTVMVWPQNTTTYTTEVRDSKDCISLPRLVTVTILPRPLTSIAIPTINGVPTNTVCYVGINTGPQDVVINLTANNNNTNLQFGVIPTYTWVSPYPESYNPILTLPTNNAITVKAPLRELNGSAVVVYTLISGYNISSFNGMVGCRRSDTVSVRVVDCRPVIDIKFTTVDYNDTICSRTCVTFKSLTDTMAGGPQKLTWTFRGGSPNTSTLTNPTVCYNFPGKYDVILRVENPYPLVDPNGGPPGSVRAVGSLSFIKVVDIPNVTILAPGQTRSDTTVRFGQAVNLNGSGALTYEWAPGYNISSLSNPEVIVKPLRTTQYILTGYNSRKCASSDTVNVIVIDDCGEMYVPNAFTPNNDGANDVLYVRGICLESLTFMVFNRWGEKVFETADQSVGWDGSYKGEAMNTGVFVYRLEGKTYDGKAFTAKGNITLIR